MPWSRVEFQLLVAPPIGLRDGPLHGAGHPVGVHDGRAPFALRAARPTVWISEPSERRKPSLSASRIATRDTSGRSSPSRKQVDADQHVELAQPQVTNDLHAFDRIDVRVQVAHADTVLAQIVRQVLRHPLGERRDQHPLVALDALANFGQHVIDLGAGGPYLHLGIHQACRPNDLLDHASECSRSYGPGVADT